MTTIEWTDVTWNPVTGCSKVSPGCAHCYAETLAPRLHAMGQKGYTDLPWTPENAEANVFTHPERLDQPLRWRKPRLVFVNSMSDLFHEQVPDEFILRVFDTIREASLTRRHVFQILTKRPERMRDFCLRVRFDGGSEHGRMWLSEPDERDTGYALMGGRHGCKPLPNVWLGVSIENRRYVHRADLLRETPAAVRFISAEPLLGPLLYDGEVGTGAHYAYEGPRVGSTEIMEPAWSCERCNGLGGTGDRLADMASCLKCGGTGVSEYEGPELDLTGIDWLIVGGESGPGHRPMRLEWARDLRDACLAGHDGGVDGVLWKRPAFFFKQWGGRTPKAGGRELDGRTWDEMPVVQP